MLFRNSGRNLFEEATIHIMADRIHAILFDFGGVIADEGFYKGLMEIGKKNGLDPHDFFSIAEAQIFETGYLTGTANEKTFWDTVRKRTSVTESDTELKDEIMKRFTLRPEMIAYADHLRSKGLIVAMLSDQTDWLDEIDRDTGLFQHFDRVFNSYHIHRSKHEATVFKYVCAELAVKPSETLFIDDNIHHVGRAKAMGLNVIHFSDIGDFKQQIKNYVALE
jgi:putative hydrolase of the HAD superfamily